MLHQLMSNTPPPFTDWLAQCDRLARRLGVMVTMRDEQWRGLYYCGLSPSEALEDY